MHMQHMNLEVGDSPICPYVEKNPESMILSYLLKVIKCGAIS